MALSGAPAPFSRCAIFDGTALDPAQQNAAGNRFYFLDLDLERISGGKNPATMTTGQALAVGIMVVIVIGQAGKR